MKKNIKKALKITVIIFSAGYFTLTAPYRTVNILEAATLQETDKLDFG